MLPARPLHVSPLPANPAEHVCIDFVNSRFNDHVGSGAEYDRLERREFQEWFAARCQLRQPPQLTPATRRDLHRLRDRLRDLLVSGRRPSTRDLAHLNRVLGRTSRALELTVDRGGVSLREHVRPAGWPAIAGRVVESYADLLVNARLADVRVCANPDCSWVFLDTSPGGRRRWCDATVCGNMIKVREFRSRQR